MQIGSPLRPGAVFWVAVVLLLCLAVSPAGAAWSPPTDRSLVGVEWNASDPSPSLRWIDGDGNTLSPPDFNNHVVWGNVRKVLLTDENVVIRGTNPRGDTLDLTGASGKVMTEIPAFYVMSANASTGSFRYYRWWISPDPADGFELHPAFVQRGGTIRPNIYVGSYEATLRVLDDGTLALDSRSGEQPWTGYGGRDPKDGMFQLGFDAGTVAPAIGATVTGSTSGATGRVVDLYVASGSWATGNAAGRLYLKQTSKTFTSNEPLTVSGSQFATADTPNGNAGITATINTFETAGEALGPGYGAMNVWTYSAIRMLHLVEYANWGSQETVGLGVVLKATGTGFNGEVTGFNSVDSNVNEWGTGTGTGSAGYTPASYRTMTDLWGNSWEWVAGYTSTNTEYQITHRNGTGSLSTHPLAAGSYESSTTAPLGSTRYVSDYWTSLEYEDLLQYQFIPNSVTGGNQSTYGTDYFYSHYPGTRVLLAGGFWDSGRKAGLGSLSSGAAASVSARYRGARLEFTGAATLHGAAPAAQYALNASAGNAPFAIAFTDTSTGTPGWWRWDFGDGTSSTDQSPVHTYTEPGTYNVTLTAYTIYGENTTTQTVEVRAPPVATFTQNATEGNAPLAVAFTDASTGNVTAWFWDFGDGTNATEQSPVHSYEVPGLYTVALNASNPYGFNITTRADLITVYEPTPTPTATSGTLPGPLPVRFVVQSYTGQPLANITVTATPLESTGPWSWLYDLFGISGDADLNGTALAGTTDTGGGIVFSLIQTVKYRVTVTDASRGIDTSITLYPQEDAVVISVWPEEGRSPAGDFSLYAEEEAGGTRVGVRYAAAGVTRVTFTVKDEAGAVLYTRTSAAPEDDLSYLLDGEPGEVFTYGYAGEHPEYGRVQKDQFIRFEGEARPLIDLAPWIPLFVYHWASIFLIVGFAMTFVRGEIRGALLTIPIIAGILWLIGWFQVPWLVIGGVLVLGILIYARMGESDLGI